MKVDELALICEKPETKIAWLEYLSMESKNIKKIAKLNLELFIENLKSEDSKIADEFAENICKLCMDTLEKEIDSLKSHRSIMWYFNSYLYFDGLKIRYPLFKEIIFPYIARKFQIKKSPYGLWLATFQQYFHSSNLKLNSFIKENECFNTKHFDAEYFDAEYFLRLNLEENPKDKLGRNMLMCMLGKALDYAFHELPEYVLDDDTIAVEKDISELETLTRESGHYNEWMDTINYWRAYNQAWSEYRTHPDKCSSFEEFVQKKFSSHIED